MSLVKEVTRERVTGNPMLCPILAPLKDGRHTRER